MAVVVDFSADKTSGLIPTSDTVQFTDLSTGSPDRWLWKFGDGNMSSEQNPEHTYDGVADETFTVSLKAWVHSSSSGVGGTGNQQEVKAPTPETSNELAMAALEAYSWTFNTPQVSTFLGFQSGLYTYLAMKQGRGYNLSAPGPLVVSRIFWVTLKNWDTDLNRGVDIQDGSFQVKNTSGSGGTVFATVSGKSPYGLVIPTVDLTDHEGAISIFVTPEFVWSQLSLPTGKFVGYICDVGLDSYEVASVDDVDDEEKVDYISFGSAPIAAFAASPTLVADGGVVQFENLTTEAVGLPTTYSWKRRKSGSGDAFVEFSTAKNPSTAFNK